MTKSELSALKDTISFIKREWHKEHENQMACPEGSKERNGWGKFAGACQAYHDSLLAIVKYFRVDIPVDMNPLPDDFDIKKNVGVFLQNRKTKV